jgi:hypothetical protein
LIAARKSTQTYQSSIPGHPHHPTLPHIRPTPSLIPHIHPIIIPPPILLLLLLIIRPLGCRRIRTQATHDCADDDIPLLVSVSELSASQTTNDGSRETGA